MYGRVSLTDVSSPPVVADILCEFLEVAIHLILYVREVYPSGIFQKRKKYNVPVQVEKNICVITILTDLKGYIPICSSSWFPILGVFIF